MVVSSVPFDEDKSIQDQIRKENEEFQKEAKEYGPTGFINGTWFEKFVRAMLSTYAEKILKDGGVEYFRNKYPGFTQDAIAEKLCKIAVQYATIAGGLTGLTSSAWVLAKDDKLPLIGAGIVATFGEILYTTHLQVRLIYDLSILYGDPIDINDPEQLIKAFMLAYGITTVSANVGTVFAKAGPEVIRAQAYRFLTGRMPMIQEVAKKLLSPKIGKAITRTAILKGLVPGAGIAISSSWNYISTKKIAKIGREEFRLEALARQAAVDLCTEAEFLSADLPIIVQALQAVIIADGSLDPCEIKVYQAVVKCLNVPVKVLQEIEDRVDINTDAVEKQLRFIKRNKLRNTMVDLIKLVASASGSITSNELDLLNRFLPALGAKVDLKELQEQASRYKRKEYNKLKDQASELGHKFSGIFRKKESKVSSEPGPVSTDVTAASITDKEEVIPE